MKRFILVLIIFIVPIFSSRAQSPSPEFARVRQINLKKELVAFSLTDENRIRISRGDALYIRNKSDEECELKVTKISKKFAFARFVDCEKMKSFSKADKVFLLDKEFQLSEKAKSNPWEFWYLYWGAGWGNYQYSGSITANIDVFANTPSTSHFPLYFELASPYFAFFRRPLLLGWILHFGWDQYRVGGSDSVPKGDIRGIHKMTGPSTFYFFGAAPGEGPFLRADLGVTWMDIDIESTTGQMLYSANKNGWGVNLGGGYSHPITNETRLLYQLLYSVRKFKSDDLSIFMLGLGWLF